MGGCLLIMSVLSEHGSQEALKKMVMEVRLGPSPVPRMQSFVCTMAVPIIRCCRKGLVFAKSATPCGCSGSKIMD